MKSRQLKFFAQDLNAYGGDLLKKRKGRKRGRPLDTRNTMHLVLRSTKAVGKWSFLRSHNKVRIEQIFKKFSARYGVKIIAMANVGNHLHLQIKLSNRFTYNPFIRAVTGAIAMAVTQTSRWRKLTTKERFWNCRPFTCVVKSLRAFLNLRDYIRVNELEGSGVPRAVAQLLVKGLNVNHSKSTAHSKNSAYFKNSA